MDHLQVSEFLPDASMCSLCVELFNEPVTLTCGHNYCNACIVRYWRGSLRNVFCPQCKQIFVEVTLRPNRQLGNIAWIIKQIQQQGGVPASRRNRCEVHQEPTKLFCKDDYVPLCSKCEKSRVHCNHIVASVEDAAEEYKYEIKVFIDVLKLLRENIRESFSDVREEKRNLVKLVDNLAQTISVDYKELYDVVRVVQMEQMILAKAIEREIESEFSNLLRKHSSMKKYIHELEKKCDQPACQFLQGIKETMNKCREESLNTPECAPPALKEKMWELALGNLSIQNTLKRCRDALPLKIKTERENITLDPFTAHSRLIVSASRKMAMYDSSSCTPVSSPLGFDTTPCVLGCEGFSSGRHCWEVELTSEGEGWALGVAKESVQRTGEVIVGFDQGIWALQPKDSALLQHKAGTFKIRVYLDYEGGCLEFFHSPSRELIATMPYITFLGEKIFPFFRLATSNCQIKVCF
uniref:Zinc finger protein RFP-like isoform X1 n=1 Tax=Pogona vitticeps TaxID=103695 RepID=A0A6J0TV44_9SAUR